ncbi:MAG: tyrosine/phenylalanine carboxypeptidase domain-containing protein, partial [Prolixibacteraceae bacterium]
MTGTFDTCRLEEIIRDLEANSGIDFPIGTTGRLYIERKLPFLLVYRTPADSGDEVIMNLVKNEASYLICPEKLYFACRLMILKIIQMLADEYGAFLLVEIWSGEMSDLSEMHAASFDLFGPASQLPQSITPLKENVRKIDLAGLAPKITLNVTDRRCPDHLEPLLNKKELKQLECLLLGLKVEPFYKSPETGQIYPVLERRLYAGFGEVFRKSVYDFIKVQGTHKLSGFQSLARRGVNPETWQIDRQLVDIDSQIHFLLLVSPVNTDGAWKEFQKSRYAKPPVFRYRMLPIDPEILKRNLFNLPIEKIDDPTLGFLFRDKRNEIDKMLNMLKSRNTEDFLYNGVLLFGTVQPWLLDAAKEIVETYPVSDASVKEGGGFYSAEEFATLAKQELVYLQKQWPGVSIRIEIKDSVIDLMVNKGILSIPLKAHF